jgi:hypothetical protein
MRSIIWPNSSVPKPFFQLTSRCRIRRGLPERVTHLATTQRTQPPTDHPFPAISQASHPALLKLHTVIPRENIFITLVFIHHTSPFLVHHIILIPTHSNPRSLRHYPPNLDQLNHHSNTALWRNSQGYVEGIFSSGTHPNTVFRMGGTTTTARGPHAPTPNAQTIVGFSCAWRCCGVEGPSMIPFGCMMCVPDNGVRCVQTTCCGRG